MLDGFTFTKSVYSNDTGESWKLWHIFIKFEDFLYHEHLNYSIHSGTKIVSSILPFVSFSFVERCYQYQSDKRINSIE